MLLIAPLWKSIFLNQQALDESVDQEEINTESYVLIGVASVLLVASLSYAYYKQRKTE